MAEKRVHPEGVGFLPAGTTTPAPAHGDETAGALFTGNWIWNPDTIAWEKATDSAVSQDGRWGAKLMEYTAGAIDYQGFNVDQAALTSAGTWWVYKFTWVGADCTMIELIKDVAWDSRAGLAWRA